ncbi:MAG: hypothetical protein QNJ63_31195 [Calothrix sp. MO_192.B10]|nr:hypothetical protein [Calothrix sp. MO_192.B10]
MSITVKWLVLPDIHILCKTKNIVKLIDGDAPLKPPEGDAPEELPEGERSHIG